MSLASTVEKGVDVAFRSVGNLAKQAILYKRNITGFNFSTSSVTANTSSSKTITVIPVKSKKWLEDKSVENVIKLSLLVKHKDIIDAQLYDSLTLDSVNWNIAHPVDDNGFTAQLNLFRSL